MTSPIDIPTFTPPQSDTPPDILALSRQIKKTFDGLDSNVTDELSMTGEKLRIQNIHTELTQLEIDALQALTQVIKRARQLESPAINLLYDAHGRLVEIDGAKYPNLQDEISRQLYSTLEQNLGSMTVEDFRRQHPSTNMDYCDIETDALPHYLTGEEISAVFARITAKRDAHYPQAHTSLRYALRPPEGWGQDNLSIIHRTSRLNVAERRLTLSAGSLAVGLSEPLLLHHNHN